MTQQISEKYFKRTTLTKGIATENITHHSCGDNMERQRHPSFSLSIDNKNVNNLDFIMLS